jgi:hypothetical protein
MSSINISGNNISTGSHTLNIYDVDRTGNTSPILSINVIKQSMLTGVDLHSHLVNREIVNNEGERRRLNKDGLYFYDWTFQEFAKTESSLYPQLIRLNFTWEAYTYNPDNFISDLRYIVNLARQYKMPILYDFFLAYTSSALYSIGSNPDSSVSNPYRGFGFPTIYTNYYAQQTYDPDPTRNEWYKHYYFWDDFLNNRITNPNTGRKMWDDFLDFFSIIINEVNDTAWGYEFLNESFLFEPEHFSKLKDFYTYVYNNIRSRIPNKWIVWGKPVLFGDARSYGGSYYSVDKWRLYVPAITERSLVSGHVYADPSSNPTSEFYKRLNAYTAAASNIPKTSTEQSLGINKVLITEHNRPLVDTSTSIPEAIVQEWVNLYKQWKVVGVLWHTWQPMIKPPSLLYTPNLQFYDPVQQRRRWTDGQGTTVINNVTYNVPDHGNKFKLFVALTRQ